MSVKCDLLDPAAIVCIFIELLLYLNSSFLIVSFAAFPSSV